MSQRIARPPRLAEWIIRFVAPPDDVRWILSDLSDELTERATSQSVAAGRRWYWAQAIRSIVPLLRRRLITFITQPRDHMWNDLAQDLRFAARLSARAPLTTIVVIVTLVLGLGATTSVFSVVDAVLVRPLPFAASSRTVQLFGVMRDGRELDELVYPDLLDLRATAHTIEMLGIGQPVPTTLDHNGEASRIDAVQVDSDFVRVLDLRVSMGRMFDPESFAFHGPNEVVLTHGFWMREFGGDRSIIGKAITLDGEHSTVIGILEERPFVYPQDSPDIIQPLRLEPGSLFTRRGVMWATAVARVRPGVATEDVSRDVAAVAHRLEIEYSYANKGIGMHVKPLRDAVVGDIGSALALLTAAVSAVLLIASLNVGNLLLARATARAREFAVRVAIGGSPWRVRRQVLAEAFLLAAVGGVLGLAIAPLITRMLLALYPGELPRASEIHVGVRALLGAIVGILTSSILASLPAMRQASSTRPGLDLRATAGGGQSSQARRFGRIVFGAQIAASLTMVFVAGLLVRSLGAMNRIRPGFEASGLLTFIASPPRDREPSPAAYYQRLRDALARIPGVTLVSTAFHIPFGGNSHGDAFTREDGAAAGRRTFRRMPTLLRRDSNVRLAAGSLPAARSRQPTTPPARRWRSSTRRSR